MRFPKLLTILGMLMLTAVLGQPMASANDVKGDIFYTSFTGTDRLFSRAFDFTGGVLTYGTENTISGSAQGLNGADGLIFDPTNTGYMLVGGQSNVMYRVNLTTGAATSSSALGASSYHMAADPSGTSAWTSGIPGSPIAKVSLTPFDSSHSTLAISGSVSAITGLAFDGSGNAYYTSSGPGGFGSFGTINTTTGVTSQLFGSVAAAHGLIYDPYTKDFILTGDDQITQYDPVSNTFVSTLTSGGQTFDQGAVDGKGHLFVASNNGNMMFVDYATSGLVNDAGNFSDVRFMHTNLDDIAPLSGLGSRTTVPEPASMLLMGMGMLGAFFRRFRRSA